MIVVAIRLRWSGPMVVGVGPVRTGIFNVADMALMLGAAIVVLKGYRPRQVSQT